MTNYEKFLPKEGDSFNPRQVQFEMDNINLLEPEFYISILAHPVGKMRIIQEPNKVALWNKRHFEEKKNGDYAACLRYSICIFVE